jgi:hypothetical protein
LLSRTDFGSPAVIELDAREEIVLVPIRFSNDRKG